MLCVPLALAFFAAPALTPATKRDAVHHVLAPLDVPHHDPAAAAGGLVEASRPSSSRRAAAAGGLTLPSLSEGNERLRICVERGAPTNLTFLEQDDTYRLGDCVKSGRSHGSSKDHGHIPAGCNKHADSVAARYLAATGGTMANTSILLKVLDAWAAADGRAVRRPDAAAVVVHLRLGDAIEGSPASPLDMLRNGGSPCTDQEMAVRGSNGWCAHMQNSIKPFSELLADVRGSGLPPGGAVKLVAGNHLAPNPPPKSSVYAHCLREAFEQEGYHTELRTHGSPDADLYYMSRARTFEPAAGSFSRLIGKLVVLRGGRVIGRRF